MSVLRYLSLFSGIEAASAAWRPLGWTCAAFAEIDPFPCAVLKHHYPGIPNLGDVTKITQSRIESLGHIDLVVFGSPCQDLSLAGKREGLKGKRSGLFFDAMRIVRWARARYALFENVPGLLSSNEGRDFAAVVGEMVGVEPDVPADGWQNSGAFLGPDGFVEMAILDAQFFGVPQRRRRVFALRDIGNWTDRPPILLERESLSGYPPPGRETREDVAPTISARTKGGGGNSGRNQIESTYIAHTLKGEGFDAGEDGTGRGIPQVPVGFNNTGHGWWNKSDTASGLRDMSAGSGSKEATLVAFSCKDHGSDASEISPTLRSMNFDKSHANSGGGKPGQGYPAALTHSGVRRLLVEECEKLQGFKPGYTKVPYRGKPAADGPRYKSLGNSFAVPVIGWIGSRIQAVEQLKTASEAA